MQEQRDTGNLYNHLSNDLIHYWIKNPNARTVQSIKFLLNSKLIGRRLTGLSNTSSLINFISKEKTKFDNRAVRKKDWIDELIKDDSPIGANPFMGEFDASKC